MRTIDGLLDALTLDEKIQLVSGASAWRTHVNERLAIPELKVSDGPNGVRGDGLPGSRSTAFPVGVCMGATWNPDLIAEVGDAIAVEARDKAIDVVLGPTINLQRTPIGGRNFECYSEDPWLSGVLATAFTQGVQARGVGACPKHFVGNDTEFERHTISSDIDERTLREVYLRPFEHVVTQAQPWSIMAAYNRVNGIYACSHNELLQDILKGEWGFDGLVVSDWYAALETVDNANGGLDLEMPGPAIAWGDRLRDAIDNGAINPAILDDKVRRLLLALQRSGKLGDADSDTTLHAPPEQHIDRPIHRALARRVASEGMVLLKNDKQRDGAALLPLSKNKLRRLAVIGPNALQPQIMGGGSSQVRPHFVQTPLDAMAEAFGNDVMLVHEPGVLTHKYIPAPPKGLLHHPEDADRFGAQLKVWYGEERSTEPDESRLTSAGNLFLGGLGADSKNRDQAPMQAELAATLTTKDSGDYTFGLACAGRARMYLDDELIIDNWIEQSPSDLFFGQGAAEKTTRKHLAAGQDHHLRIEFASRDDVRFRALRYGILPPVPTDLEQQALDAARAADAVIFMAGTNMDWETEGNDRDTLTLPGAQDQLIAAVCEANANTVVVINAGAPVAMPWLSQAAAVVQAWFAGQEFGTALTDLLLGDTAPSGRLPLTVPASLQETPAWASYPGKAGRMPYGEKQLIGHRWYHEQQRAPVFPFGHGLTYTEFSYEHISVDVATMQARVALRNIGDREGMETVQLYLQPVAGACSAEMQAVPLKLAGFSKILLQPGNSQEIMINLDPRCLQYWDSTNKRWCDAAGRFILHAAASASDLRCHTEFDVR